MADKCPLCGQVLPRSISTKDLQARWKQRLSAEAAQRERRLRQDLERQHQRELQEREISAERKAQEAAEQHFQQRLRDAENRTRVLEAGFESRLRRQLGEARRDADRRARQAVAKTERRLQEIEAQRRKERARYERDQDRFREQVESLEQKLKAQTSGQLGDEAEVDLFGSLSRAFPSDRIDRVEKGATGADIIQLVREDGVEVGKIIYESKNVSTWQNAFLNKAREYRTKYETPYVLVVTRILPKKKKGMHVVKGVLVVEPHLAPVLAGIIRESIIELARLRTSKSGRATKAQELFDYILSNEFQTRFTEIADGAAELRELQEKEKDWHERHWDKQSSLHKQIETRRRELGAHISNLTGKKLRVARATA